MKKVPIEILNDPASVTPANNFYTRFGKRTFDVILSGTAIVILSPVLAVVSVLELKFHGKPVLYRTIRPGKDGIPFKMSKFRSMTNDRDSSGRLLPPKERLTKFGIFIRRASLDELPQLFSIFKGDMSIIGPRPLLMEYLDYYSPRHSMRHYVRPGLACVRLHEKPDDTWTWADQFENDIWYVENLSFKTDFLELFAVLKKTIFPDKFRAYATRVPFLGNETLYETRSLSEAGLEKVRFDSISMQ